MKFIALEVENIFAYNGRSRIDLSDCSEDKNIIVVSGPNGAGKTSLLNAVKLLFLGHNNEELRRVGFAGTALTAKQYVTGVPGRWYGVFNTASGQSSSAQVSLEWSNQGKSFRARRLYTRRGGTNDFDHKVEVTVDDTPLLGEDNESALQQLLPREVVRFFFFDGEQIQSLADAEVGRERAEIERLLGLSFVVQLLGQLEEYVKSRGRSGLPEDVRVKIVAAENSAREESAKAEAAGRARVAIEDELLDLERQRRRFEEEGMRLRSGALSESERKRIVSRLFVLESQRDTLAERIADIIPPESVFLTQPSLISQSFELLDRHVGSGADASLASRLHRDLPDRLVVGLADLSPPVRLTPTQTDDFAVVVGTSLGELGVANDGPSHPLLASLSPRRASALRDQFLVWAEKGPLLANDNRDQLIEMRQIAFEMQRLRKELDEAELTTDEAKNRHEELLEEIRLADANIRHAIERSAELKIEEQRALRDAAANADRAAELENEYRHVSTQNARYRLGLEVSRALDEYRMRRRAEIRGSVERRLNERVGILLAPSKLVKTVSLDDQFGMSYFDEWGEKVARHSISAGMRQLLAMAMLWALKDEAERPLPVMVDTPLGRIDRENRNLLMTEYFPRAGNPLVLLPTDTEFGEAGFDAIGDRVRRRYRIVNENGNNARLIEESSTGAGRAER